MYHCDRPSRKKKCRLCWEERQRHKPPVVGIPWGEYLERHLKVVFPTLEEYGIPRETYAFYSSPETHRSQTKTNFCPWSVGLSAVLWLGIARVLGSEHTDGVCVAAMFGVPLTSAVVVWCAEAIAFRLNYRHLCTPQAIARIARYEEHLNRYHNSMGKIRYSWEEQMRALRLAEHRRIEAQRARERENREYWMQLNGLEFERELAGLFMCYGYRVESTPASGDEGVDLVLRKNGKTIVVQCKSHQAPIGPAIVRELYGSMIASRADGAVLACTGGFTRGVVRFAEGKPITLLSAQEITQAVLRYESRASESAGGDPFIAGA